MVYIRGVIVISCQAADLYFICTPDSETLFLVTFFSGSKTLHFCEVPRLAVQLGFFLLLTGFEDAEIGLTFLYPCESLASRNFVLF